MSDVEQAHPGKGLIAFGLKRDVQKGENSIIGIWPPSWWLSRTASSRL